MPKNPTTLKESKMVINRLSRFYFNAITWLEEPVGTYNLPPREEESMEQLEESMPEKRKVSSILTTFQSTEPLEINGCLRCEKFFKWLPWNLSNYVVQYRPDGGYYGMCFDFG